MVEKLISFFKQPSENTRWKTPGGLCPNCWGVQEFDNVIRDMYEDQQTDVSNHSANFAFIKDFRVTRLNGIKLTRGNNGLECPACRFTISGFKKTPISSLDLNCKSVIYYSKLLIINSASASTLTFLIHHF